MVDEISFAARGLRQLVGPKANKTWLDLQSRGLSASGMEWKATDQKSSTGMRGWQYAAEGRRADERS